MNMTLKPFQRWRIIIIFLYREDERELISICKQMNVLLIPYSPLTVGHLARVMWKSD